MDGQSALNLKEFTRQEHAPTIGLLSAPALASWVGRPSDRMLEGIADGVEEPAAPASAVARKLAAASAGAITHLAH